MGAAGSSGTPRRIMDSRRSRKGSCRGTPGGTPNSYGRGVGGTASHTSAEEDIPMATVPRQPPKSDTAHDTLAKKSQDASMISGGHLVATALKNEGIDTIFTLCGGHIIDIYDGCIDNGIRIVD